MRYIGLAIMFFVIAVIGHLVECRLFSQENTTAIAAFPSNVMDTETTTTKSGDFSMTLVRSKQRIYKIGDKIHFELSVTHPGKYKFYNWHATASKNTVPPSFNGWKKGTQIVGDLRWIPNASPQKTKVHCILDTKGYPAGDYNFTIVPRCDAIEKGISPDIKLQSQHFDFSLEAQEESPVPVIDGKVDDAAWVQIPWMSNFKKLGTSVNAEVQTRYKYYCDGKMLYFLVECDEPAMDRLRAMPATKNSGGLWKNDSVELKVCNDETLSQFYKVVVDCIGQYSGGNYIDKNTSDRGYATVDFWDAHAETAVTKSEKHWIVEVALPIGAFNNNEKITQNWRIDVGRNRYAGGNMELSSGGIYSKVSHIMANEFPKVKLEAFKVDPFLIKFDSMQHKIVQGNNEELVCVTKGNLFNERKYGCNIIIKTYFTDGAGTVKGENSQFCGVYSGHACPIVLETSCKEPGNYTYYIEFWTNETKSKLLKVYCMPMEVYYSPYKAKLIRPCYRNNIYASMPDKNIEVNVSVSKNAGRELIFKLKDEKERIVAEKRIVSTAENRFLLDAKALPDGRYSLQIFMKEAGHDYVEKIPIRKLPYQKGEVWIDRNGATYVDGKPFIPMGWYVVERTRTLGPAENVVINHSFFAKDFKTFQHYLDTIWASGRKMIIRPYQVFDGLGEDDPRKKHTFDRSQQVKSMTKEQIDYLTRNIPRMSRHPGILAWYLSDEPETSNVTTEWLSQVRELLAELDPYHPCTITNFSEAGMKKFADSCDIIFPDCYPGYFEKIHTNKALATTNKGKVARELKKPSWLILPGTLFPTVNSEDSSIRGIPPGYEDIRRQTYEGLIQNMMGYTFFASMDGLRYSSLIIGLPAICTHLEALKPYVITPTLDVKAKAVPAEKDFVCGMKMLGNDFVLLAVNGCSQEQSVTYSLPLKFNGRLYNAGAAKEIIVKDGSFSDKIPGWKNRIYLSDKVLAKSLESTEAIEKRIIEHYKGRKRPGNLLAVGELLLADMVAYNLAPEKRPKSITDVKASSYVPHYYTSYSPSRNTGPLYFTVDGIRLPTRMEFCWRPISDDKEPYLLYTIPKPSKVNEARIYTPCGNLRKGIVATDTHKYEFDNSQKQSEEIIIRLSEETTSSLKIIVKDYTWIPHDNQLGTNSCSGVISEVELY